MLALCHARLLIALIPFRRWQGRLGFAGVDSGLKDARRLAGMVNRAGERLPFETKCLPRAMALSWILRRHAIGHAVVIAVRPADRREEEDALHAWVEVANERILGDLPGPWIETLRLPDREPR